MEREQDTSSARTKAGADSSRAKGGAAAPSRSAPPKSAGLVRLQRMAGNRAVAGMMARPATVQRHELDEKIMEKVEDLDSDTVATKLAEAVTVQRHELDEKIMEKLGDLDLDTVATKLAKTVKGGGVTGASTAGGLVGGKLPAATKTQYLDLIQKHDHQLKGDESDEEISDLAEMFKAEDTAAKAKRKEKLLNRRAVEAAAKQGRVQLTGNETDDEIADLAENLKAEDTADKTKRKEKLQNRKTVEAAAKQGRIQLTGNETDDDYADLAESLKDEDTQAKKKRKEKLQSETAAKKLIAAGQKAGGMAGLLGGRRF